MSLLVFPFAIVSSAYVPVQTMPGWLRPFAERSLADEEERLIRLWQLRHLGWNRG